MRQRWLVNQLPGGMLDDDLLVRFVSMFEVLADTLVDHADTVEHLLDPAVTPEPMLRFLARWLGVDSLDDATPLSAQRRMVADIGDLIGTRGTRRGLAHALELLTGHQPRIDDNGGVFLEGEAPFTAPHVDIALDSAGWTEPEHLVTLLLDEIPASVTFELRIGDERWWPRPSVLERAVAR